MLRACFTIVAVAGISAGIVYLRDAQGSDAASTKANSNPLAWVRTIDGWEPSSVLEHVPGPTGPPSVHPGLVACLQLGVSLFALLALPTRNPAVSRP